MCPASLSGAWVFIESGAGSFFFAFLELVVLKITDAKGIFQHGHTNTWLRLHSSVVPPRRTWYPQPRIKDEPIEPLNCTKSLDMSWWMTSWSLGHKFISFWSKQFANNPIWPNWPPISPSARVIRNDGSIDQLYWSTELLAPYLFNGAHF